MNVIAVLCINLWAALQCSAFIITTKSSPSRPSSINTLTLAMISNNREVPADPNPQEIRSFLTQRSIQSFMFLLASTRDLHTVQWLDNFTKPVIINNYWEEDDEQVNPGVGDAFRENDKRLGSKLLNYHGLSALNTTMFPEWDSFFTNLLKQPDAVLRIKTPTDVGRRAYSKFEIDINPASLCSRIISVREQIANELCGDLKAISTMGQLIFSSYHYNKENQNNTKSSGKKGGIGYKDGTSPNGIDKPSMLYMNFDPLIDSPFAPSPLRKGNFDLLYNLITQEAVVDLLRNGVFVGDDEIQNEASLRYLEKFYRDRVVTHFVGAQFYWKGDEFIEEMMLASPIVMFDDFDESAQEDADTSEIEPLRVAEQVLLRRDALALEWLEIMQAVPSHHAAIRKAQLDRMMGQGPAVEEQTDTKVIVTTDDFQ